MKVGIFQTHKYERSGLEEANKIYGYDIKFLEPRLTIDTVDLANGCDVVCSFANDKVDRSVVKALKEKGVKLIATRSAGYNHIDVAAARDFGIPVVRVPEYSPHAVAEHAVALILSLNRKIHHACLRVRELNFTLDGLVGFDLFGKTVGVIGTGRIGAVFARIMRGFGMQVLAYDMVEDKRLVAEGVVRYTSLDEIFASSDIISFHVPLTPKTRHLINAETIAKMKTGVMLINTGRGALIDSQALIDGLKKRKVGAAGLDVYEEEEGIFFENLSDSVLEDDLLARLLTFPNVLITSHQAFLTKEALKNIADVTLKNIADFAEKKHLANQILL